MMVRKVQVEITYSMDMTKLIVVLSKISKAFLDDDEICLESVRMLP